MEKYKELEWNTVIKELLDKHLMTQEEIADRCGVSQKSVSFWLKSTYKPSKYAQKKLHVLLSELKVEQVLKDDMNISSIYKKLSPKKKVFLLEFAQLLSEY